MDKKRNNKGQFIAFQKIPKNCLLCSKVFFVLGKMKKKYCSTDCYYQSRIGIKRDTKIGKKISKSKKGNVVISEKQRKQISDTLKRKGICPPYRIGYKLTKNHCKNISKALKGLKHSQSWCDNISKGLTGKKIPYEVRKKTMGKNHYLWKGGITPINEAIRHTYEYRNWRTAIFKRDNWTCIWCGTRGAKLNADHIKPFARHPELRFAIDNGRTLCIECHKKTETYGGKNRQILV